MSKLLFQKILEDTEQQADCSKDQVGKQQQQINFWNSGADSMGRDGGGGEPDPPLELWGRGQCYIIVFKNMFWIHKNLLLIY